MKILNIIGTLTLSAILILGCENEEVIPNEKTSTISSKKITKSVKNGVYPISITLDLSIEENLEEVITNLSGGEYLYSEVIDGIQYNEVRLNTIHDDFPEEPYDQYISEDDGTWYICHIEQEGCLYWAAQHHLYNIDHCDNSRLGLDHFGYIIVYGDNCNIV